MGGAGNPSFSASAVFGMWGFPLPWPVSDQDGCFVVRDRNGQALSNVYFEDEPKHHLFTHEEARHIARNLAKLRTFETGLVATEPLVLPAPGASATLSAEGANTSRSFFSAWLVRQFRGVFWSGSPPERIAAICYVAVTALTERFWQNPAQSEVRPDRPARSVGWFIRCVMKNGIAMQGDLSSEYFVLQINGRTNSVHRRYEDAVRVGLLLKNQFPHVAIKVCEVDSIEEVAQATPFH
jgi:hypothetical protein